MKFINIVIKTCAAFLVIVPCYLVSRGILISVALALVFPYTSGAAEVSPTTPRLLLQITIDQLRGDIPF